MMNRPRDNIERILYPELVRWIGHNYPLARAQLEHNSVANSVGKHNDVETSLLVGSQTVWMSVCLNVCRTIPSDCWVCVGPHDFVRASYVQSIRSWEDWE
jgi:hypothetical protein